MTVLHGNSILFGQSGPLRLSPSLIRYTLLMRYFALATDYDGTLAKDGKVDESTIAALRRLRESGRVPILVTGRQMKELLEVFPHPEIFERIVAENGAVLYNPATRNESMLGDQPPNRLISLLRERGVPISVGRVILATITPHEVAVIEAVRELGLEWQVIFNKGAVMLLPPGVNKASGLRAALEELGLSPHAVVGVGDAENDHAFLESCECSVAVSNALSALKERADLTTVRDHGAGVTELIERLVANDLDEADALLERHYIPLGRREDGSPLNVRAYGASILIAGTSGGGKSTLTTGFIERLRAKKYQFCIVDPEGDYSELDSVVLGNQDHAPSPSEVIDVLTNPDQNVVINLSGMKLEERPQFFERLLPHFQDLRAKTGRPHWFFIDETHHLLPDAKDVSSWLPESMHGIWLVTVHPKHVSKPVLNLVNMVLAIGAAPAETIASFSEKLGERPPQTPTVKLEPGEAIVWKRDSGDAPFWMRSIPAAMERQRHRRKYAEGELPPDRSFYFRGPEGKLNLRAQNLELFLQLADGVDDETWRHHLSAGDYSAWFRAGIKDNELAAAVEELERRNGISDRESRAAIRALVEERYTAPE